MASVMHREPDQACIMLTGQGSEDLAVAALKLGAKDYIVKDLESNYLELLPVVINRVAKEKSVADALKASEQAQGRLEASNRYLAASLNQSNVKSGLIGQDPAFNRITAFVQQVAPTNATVLITGETGTGKEMIAQLIHRLSPRHNEPFITINCAALPAQLVESELFGHTKGAFTGATKNQIGRFEAADGGTIFLDEIGEMPLDLQPKLLRVLQESTFQRLGSNDTQHVDVRVIAATNDNLPQEVSNHRFREDLYYRLNVIPIHIPPLHERPRDIELLFMHFVRKYSEAHSLVAPDANAEIIERVNQYKWPGNVRELSNYVERGIITQQWGPFAHPIEAVTEDRSTPPPTPTPAAATPISNQSEADTWQPLDDVERQYILQVLRHTKGVISGETGAARILDLHPNTLRSRMQKLRIEKPTPKFE